MAALALLLDAGRSNEKTLIAALQQDFGRRAAHETRLLEIFPVVDEIQFIRNIYFDQDAQRVQTVLERTVSGGVTISGCIFHHTQHRLPFGGVGASGHGTHHGFEGVPTFSKKKGVLFQHELTAWIFGKLANPPYGRHTDWLSSLLMRH